MVHKSVGDSRNEDEGRFHHTHDSPEKTQQEGRFLVPDVTLGSPTLLFPDVQTFGAQWLGLGDGADCENKESGRILREKRKFCSPKRKRQIIAPP